MSHPLLVQRKRAGARGHLHLFKPLADFYLARTTAGGEPPSRAELQQAGQAIHAAQCRCGKVGWKPCKDWLTAWRAWLVAESPLPPGDDQQEAQVSAWQLAARGGLSCYPRWLLSGRCGFCHAAARGAGLGLVGGGRCRQCWWRWSWRWRWWWGRNSSGSG